MSTILVRIQDLHLSKPIMSEIQNIQAELNRIKAEVAKLEAERQQELEIQAEWEAVAKIIQAKLNNV